MRAVVQRVSESRVLVEGAVVGEIGPGLLVLLGVEAGDTREEMIYLAGKITDLRIFNDDDGKFNRTLEDVKGSLLLVSQFTLLGDCRRGRRPSFTQAARPEEAIPLYEGMAAHWREQGFTVATGVFGAHMDVHLVNDGPVTLLLDSKKTF
ncbi:MAG: D-tyrosyl-tRNA(Tyr) deacylase [Candidatus Hydrogenedentes bacterium]|nr:D-tyrosyl-tRNA(Tyr) deacylase [Candidatus Hydrogenedentota bacterium]